MRSASCSGEERIDSVEGGEGDLLNAFGPTLGFGVEIGGVGFHPPEFRRARAAARRE